MSSSQVALTTTRSGRLWQTPSASLGVTQFLHDGDHVAVEYNGATGAIARHFFWGQGIDEPVLLDEGGSIICSGTRFLHADHQGSVIAVADCGGNRVAVDTYDEYGIPGAGSSGRPAVHRPGTVRRPRPVHAAYPIGIRTRSTKCLHAI